MTLFALALVLASAGIHATWNLWTKQLGSGFRSAPLLWLLTTISSVVYAPFVLWLLTHGTWRPTTQAVLVTMASGAIHIIYFGLLLRGYRVGDLSVVYPVARGTGPMLAFLGALVLFREHATPLSVAGALLVATGVLILTWRTGAADARKLAPGLRYGLATGVLIACYTLWDGWSVKVGAVPPLVFYWGGEVTRVLLLSPLALRDRDGIASIWRTQRARVLGIALLSPLSYILVLLAMRTGAVSHIAPAREISILLGAYLGTRVLGEGEKRRRIVAAVAFAAGVVALALA